jgi:hypothetical protein
LKKWNTGDLHFAWILDQKRNLLTVDHHRYLLFQSSFGSYCLLDAAILNQIEQELKQLLKANPWKTCDLSQYDQTQHIAEPIHAADGQVLQVEEMSLWTKKGHLPSV